MPTYDYRCKACGHEMELFQSMTERPKRKCPACGRPRLERLIGTGAGVIFKGSGFYETDYRSESYKKSADAESKPASTSAAGEAKPASKPDPKPDATPEKAAATPKEGSRAPAEPKARPARSARGSRRRNA